MVPEPCAMLAVYVSLASFFGRQYTNVHRLCEVNTQDGRQTHDQLEFAPEVIRSRVAHCMTVNTTAAYELNQRPSSQKFNISLLLSDSSPACSSRLVPSVV